MDYNFLIVDDSMIIRKMIAKTLTISGLDIGEIFFAENGEQALDQLRKNRVHMVFSDINMPDMNGIEMIEEMRNQDLLPSIPVIIIATEHNRQRIETLKAMGVKAYLRKPFIPEEFYRVIKELLH